MKKESLRVSEILNFGQGDDDIILECTRAISNMLEGYYTLEGTSTGSGWWESLNRTVWHDELISEQWNKIDWDKVIDALNIIEIVLKGEYIRSRKFVEALELEKELGHGFRPKGESYGNKEGKS